MPLRMRNFNLQRYTKIGSKQTKVHGTISNPQRFPIESHHPIG